MLLFPHAPVLAPAQQHQQHVQQPQQGCAFCLLSAIGDGTGEGLVRVYYSCVGWPTFLPTNEQDVFAAKVYQLKQQQMKKLIAEGAIPLRDGVVQVRSLMHGFHSEVAVAL
jgi:hypothetical protein